MDEDPWIALMIASIITIIAATPYYYSRDYAHGPIEKISEGSDTKMTDLQVLESDSVDSDTIANLHNIYLACKAYWSIRGPDASCSMYIIKDRVYEYVQSDDVVIAMEPNNEENILAYAFHKEFKRVWTLDANGNIE